MKFPLHALITLLIVGCADDSMDPIPRPNRDQLQGCWLRDSSGFDSTLWRTLLCFRDSNFYMAWQIPHHDEYEWKYDGIESFEGYGTFVITDRGILLKGMLFSDKGSPYVYQAIDDDYELLLSEDGKILEHLAYGSTNLKGETKWFDSTWAWGPREAPYFFSQFSVAHKPSWW